MPFIPINFQGTPSLYSACQGRGIGLSLILEKRVVFKTYELGIPQL